MPKRPSVDKRKEAKVCQIEGRNGEPEASPASLLAELAADSGRTDAEPLSAYRSALDVHGERVEDRMGEEFSIWLIKFAKSVAGDVTRTQAWERLKTKCDVLLLLNDLYLFTYPEESEHGTKKTTADVLKNACRFLMEELDKLIPRYGTLQEKAAEVFADPKLKLVGVLSSDMSGLFNEPMALMKTAEQELRIVRNWAAKMASLKTDGNDLYLYSMAARVRKSTGKFHFGELMTLTEAAPLPMVEKTSNLWIRKH